MTFSFCRSVRHVVQTTLLLAGLSLAANPELLAEEASREAPQEDEESDNVGRFKTIAATSLGATGGVLVVPVLPTLGCINKAHYDNSVVLETCFVIGIGTSVLGGIAGAHFGKKNVGLVVVGGGALLFGVLGTVPGEAFGATAHGFLLGATAGGYLGYRLWKARESDGEQYSLLPYWDEERSGVMLSGRF